MATVSSDAFVRSRLAIIPLIALGGMTALAQSKTGVHPRASASDYSTQQQVQGAAYAASVLPPRSSEASLRGRHQQDVCCI
jgi:hypothetical protein